ncbi:MAG: hypothetical protein Q8T03_02725 [Bacteroidota bacterium]|nr:hypothetical protein [Bacteroidota bacterium]
MKKIIKLLAFQFSLILFSCTQNTPNVFIKKVVEDNDSAQWQVISDVNDNISNTVGRILRLNKDTSFFDFELQTVFCKKNQDTTIIYFQRGFGPVSIFTIKIINNRFKLKFVEINETLVNSYTIVSQKLSLDQRENKIGDSINIHLECNAFFHNSKINKNDTIIIIGNFTTKIHGENYNFDSFKLELDSLKMLKLLKTERPDTIFEINFTRCGLRKIPKELENFKNLHYLTLDMNDLSDENFILFEKLPNLKLISLSRCNITVFPFKILNLLKIEEIDLTHNLITKIPDEVYTKKNLKVIDLSYNKLLDSTKVKLDNKGRIKKINLDGTN